MTMIKDFFYYTRSERRGIILLSILILIVLLISVFSDDKSVHQQRIHDKNFDKDYQAFIHSIEILNRKEYNKYYHPQFDREIVLAPFDPNTVDSLTLLRLGLPRWMAHNIIKYRTKGGKFRKPEDFKKIYGMTDERFAMLLPYINIKGARRDTIRAVVHDTTFHPVYPVKYTATVKLELNAADTTELKKIPGVGSNIARMIVRYRNQLGGYYSIKQLEEIHLISSRLAKWFTINPALIHKIDVNEAGISRLKSHPYINFYQAKVFVEHRRRHGNIKSFSQLSLYEEFGQADFERMSHYITFD